MQRQTSTTAWNRKHTGLLFWKKKCPEVWSERVQRGLVLERKSKVIQCRGAEDRKGMGTNLMERKGKVILFRGAEDRKGMGTNLMERKGKVIPFRGAEDRKGMGTNLSEGKGKVIQCTDVEELKTEKAQVTGINLSERNRKVVPHRGTEDRKDTGINRGMSGTRNLKAESETDSIRSRAEYNYKSVCKVEDSHKDKMKQCP